jgi:hypothetical protein
MTNRASRPEAWFEKADHDLLAIEQLMAASVVVWDIVAFHAREIRAGVETAREIRRAIRERTGHGPLATT